jgi:hypothetical protein
MYTIVVHYLYALRDQCADAGDLGLATSIQLALDDLCTGPWVWLDVGLTIARGLPPAQARSELQLAISRLSQLCPDDHAQQVLLETRYHLLPLLHCTWA